MTNREIVPVATAIQQWTPADQALIRQMVAPKATDGEFKIFLYQAWKYQLDPLAKEIYAIRYKDGDPISFVVAHAGFLSIAHRTGQYGGMDSDELLDDAGKLVGAVATVWRRDGQHPTVVRVRFSEYNPNNRQWQAKPATMIKKVAEAQALRRAFNISGLYAPEEFGGDEGDLTTVDPATGEIQGEAHEVPNESPAGHAPVNAGRSALPAEPPRPPAPAPTPIRARQPATAEPPASEQEFNTLAAPPAGNPTPARARLLERFQMACQRRNLNERDTCAALAKRLGKRWAEVTDGELQDECLRIERGAA